MALVPKLELRQGQQLVMTPQLQQAIRLLQLSNVELCSFVEAEVERNPLLESEDVAPEPTPDTQAAQRQGRRADDEANANGSGDWSDGATRLLSTGPSAMPARRAVHPQLNGAGTDAAGGPRCGSAPAMLSAARRAIWRTSSRPGGRWPTT